MPVSVNPYISIVGKILLKFFVIYHEGQIFGYVYATIISRVQVFQM
jgi:hypothetical protein